MIAGELDLSKMSALVLDEKHFERSISLNQLRGLGLMRVLGVSTVDEAWGLILREEPSLIFIEWMRANSETLDFVRRIRAGAAPYREAPIFMLTSRSAKGDVVAAREAGVNGYLRKPITANGMQQRVRRVIDDPQEFIVSDEYVGPSRRRSRKGVRHDGPGRRPTDRPHLLGDREDDLGDVRLELARARVSVLEEAARGLALTLDEAAARKTYKAAAALVEVAEQIADSYLVMGGKELMRYLEAHPSTAAIDPNAVSIHVTALHQLVHLPEALGAQRDRVAQSLHRMVEKKLRSATAKAR